MTDSIDVAIGVIDGKVIANWRQPTTLIEFDPQNAYKVGMALASAAMEAHKGSRINAQPFIESELAKPKVMDQQRDYLIGLVSTQLKSLIEKGATPGRMAMHAVDAVLQEVAR